MLEYLSEARWLNEIGHDTKSCGNLKKDPLYKITS
jgi:hypothetical protein